MLDEVSVIMIRFAALYGAATTPHKTTGSELSRKPLHFPFAASDTIRPLSVSLTFGAETYLVNITEGLL